MNEELLPATTGAGALDVRRAPPTAIDILQAAVAGGITAENVAVVKEIRQMVQEERNAAAKSAFNRDYFDLRQEIATLDFYADKAGKTDGGAVAYTYCSEKELASKLDPVLSRHRFAMLFGQRDEHERIVAIITLIHREGHEETREYSVRSGSTNRMKDATAADTGATTSAWRHLVIKMFGLKSRIQEGDDARNLGGKITPDQAFELERRCAEQHMDPKAFLRLAHADKFSEVCEAKYEVLDEVLKARERKKA